MGNPQAPFGTDALYKFGENLSIDTNSTPEDVWSYGGVYPWPAAAAVTTIVSDSVEDDAAAEGTGAWIVVVTGLDSQYRQVNENVSMDGTDAVTLETEFLRVHRAFVGTAGSNDVNVGTISIAHGATVIAEITPTTGQTLMAIWTSPANYEKAVLTRGKVSMGKTAVAAYAHVTVEYRPWGGAWRTFVTLLLQSSGSSSVPLDVETVQELPPGVDLRIRVDEVSANDISITAQFEMRLHRRSAQALALIMADDYVFAG